MKVCHIASGDLWAGAEVVTCQLLAGLAKYKDVSLSAILLNEGRLAKEIQKLGIPLFMVDENGKSFLEISREIKKILSKYPVDIIHSHRYKENAIAYIVSRSKKNIRLISTQHGMLELYGGKKNLKHIIISRINFFLLSRRFQYIAAVSQDIQRTFINNHNFPAHKVKVIHNGIAVPEDTTANRQNEIFVIGSSGRFFPVKDYPFMIEIAREVSRQTESIVFELAGNGPEVLNITKLIEKYGLEKIFLLRGFMDDISDFYGGLDVYINTSFHEGIPMSILEAMSYGIPVIAPKVGGLTEIIDDGVNGYLVEGRNAKDFAERCMSLYENDKLRKEMGLAARKKIIQDFSMDQMAREYHNLYLSNMAIG